MINAFAALAYFGIFCAALLLLLIADVLLQAVPQAAVLPYVVLLLISFALPIIAARGGK